jgi:uncharacterized membrane protein
MSFDTPVALLLLPIVLGGATWMWLRRLKGRPSARRIVALALRLLVFSALILAAAGMTLDRPTNAQAVAFVGDLSASTTGGQPGMVSFIDAAMRARSSGDLAGIVATGQSSTVEQPPSTIAGIQRFESVINPDYTNLESGLALGGALLPSTYRRRVVLLSDGRENLGDAAGEAALLRSEGIRVDSAPVTSPTGPEVRIDSVTVPANVHQGERFTLDADVHSTVSTTTSFQVFQDGQLAGSGTARLQVGETSISRSFQAGTAGVHTYSMVVQPQEDTLPQNNQASAFTTVSGPARVLVVEGTKGNGSNVAASIRAAHLTAEVVEADALTSDLTVLQRYASIVLVDVPADVLGADTMEVLRSFVADLGHGLVAIGGTNSYGMGNYGSTPLEAALPVSMDLPKRKDLPTAAVVLIIEDLESETSVNISKRAGEGVVSLLNPQDQVAVSDAQSSLVWPLSHVTNKSAIVRAIEQMQPADPPSYTPFLQQAFEILKSAQAQTKHIILLGDGDAASDSTAVLKQIYKAGIRVSTIETNAAAPSDFQNMQDIARFGGGKYYPADNVNTIPEVFLKVAKTVAHSGIMEGKFFPQAVAPSPIIDGLTSVPQLTGYTITTPKPLGTVVLASDKSDPILAQWQYGLGRSVAWTSDATGKWTAAWLASPQTRAMWASMVSWTLPPPQSSSLSLVTSVSGGALTVGVDSSDGQAYQSLSAHIVGPQGAQTITLQPSAPNRFEGTAPAPAAGVYLIDVQAKLASTGKAKLTRTVSGGIAVPYAPDFRDSGVDETALQAIARAGGGSMLTRPQDAFAQNLPPVNVATPLQDMLLVIALLLLPFDVAARRLVLEREDWLALLHAVTFRRQDSRDVPSPVSAMRERQIARARRVRSQSVSAASHLVPARSSETTARRAGTEAPKPNIGATPQESPPAAKEISEDRHSGSPAIAATKVTDDSSTSAAGRLLDAKRRARR